MMMELVKYCLILGVKVGLKKKVLKKKEKKLKLRFERKKRD